MLPGAFGADPPSPGSEPDHSRKPNLLGAPPGPPDEDGWPARQFYKENTKADQV